ncbi:S1C family serine protease, partial [Leucobacter sp. M11]|uniref:S1C family serine protease n=1 Tax=Leucobacter sp. M11 TaxID=2993565 RepID=UPI002D7F9ED9
ISKDGYILTNSHVVTLDSTPRDQVGVRVFLSDGRILTGTIVGADPYSDLAVVKVEADDLQPIEMADSSTLGVGDLTVAIGAPLNLSSTVTSGVISALNRGITVGSTAVPEDPQQQESQPSDPRDLWNFDFDRGPEGEQEPQQQAPSGSITLPVIQTDASINPGNSGGALLDGEGRLIGINVAIASTSASGDTAGSVGLGFAIPVNLAQRVAESLIKGEAPSHGLLGVTVGDASGDARASQSGAMLGELTRGGAAEKAGLRSGDVVTSFDGIPVVDGTSLSALVRSVAGGTSVELGYLRDGKQKTVEVTLGTLDT